MDAKKPSMGRQKIKMAKIQMKNHLQVTFSKRRSGLMKKASELCTLCGVEMAIIVFSPAGKVFPFGHPSVDTIIDRFLTTTTGGNPPPPNNSSSGALSLVEEHRKASIRELNLRLTQLLSELEVEKKRSEAFEVMRKTSRRHCYYWWETPICELGFHELEQLRDSMEELKKVVVQQANNKLITINEMTNCSSSSSSSIFALNINAGAGNLYHDRYESKPNCRDVIRFGYI